MRARSESLMLTSILLLTTCTSEILYAEVKSERGQPLTSSSLPGNDITDADSDNPQEYKHFARHRISSREQNI